MLREKPANDPSHIGKGAKPLHLMLALCFAFKYDTEDDLGHYFNNMTAKTVSKWTKIYAKKVSLLLDEMMGTLKSNNKGLKWIMSVDGTCCPIWEPQPWSKENACHKFGNELGVNYEVGLLLLEPKLI